MPRYRITLAYDGTDFVGWQRQPSGTSVQGLLEDALRDLDQRDVTVVGAGRTDAGVHALEQVAAFTLGRDIGAAALVRAVNVRLPDAVRVLTAQPASEDFHPQFDSTGKAYRYRIWNGLVLLPFERRYVWHVPCDLDVDGMQRAAKMVEGKHDFAAFQATDSDTKTTTREVFTSEVRSQKYEVVYDVSGGGFLRHMVRTIAGTLVDIGRGRFPAERMEEILASRDRTKAGRTAPATGLFLVRVNYR